MRTGWKFNCLNILFLAIILFSISGCDLQRQMDELSLDSPSQDFEAEHGTEYHWKVTTTPGKKYNLILSSGNNPQNEYPSLSVSGGSSCKDCKEYVAGQITSDSLVVSFISPESGIVNALVFWNGNDTVVNIRLSEIK